MSPQPIAIAVSGEVRKTGRGRFSVGVGALDDTLDSSPDRDDNYVVISDFTTMKEEEHYVCGNCGRSFADRQLLHEHVAIAHAD